VIHGGKEQKNIVTCRNVVLFPQIHMTAVAAWLIFCESGFDRRFLNLSHLQGKSNAYVLNIDRPSCLFVLEQNAEIVVARSQSAIGVLNLMLKKRRSFLFFPAASV